MVFVNNITSIESAEGWMWVADDKISVGVFFHSGSNL